MESNMWKCKMIVLMFIINLSFACLQATQSDKIKNEIVLGNPTSKIEIYVISDWFCGSCKRIEPKIEQIFSSFQNKAAFYFVDYPIHKDTSNYTPYHLAFLVNNKYQYKEARQALLELSKKEKDPSDDAVSQMAQNYGVKLQELSFTEVKQGMSFFDKLIKQYKVNSTPTLIIVNKETSESEKLRGNEINETKVNEVYKKLSQSSS